MRMRKSKFMNRKESFHFKGQLTPKLAPSRMKPKIPQNIRGVKLIYKLWGSEWKRKYKYSSLLLMLILLPVLVSLGKVIGTEESVSAMLCNEWVNMTYPWS